MRRIEVDLGRPQEISLVEFLETGDSFRMCSTAHRWPPLETFNAFLECGIDDVGDDSMVWQAFEVDESEYAAAREEVDPIGTVDALGMAAGDWRSWFLAAAGIVRPN